MQHVREIIVELPFKVEMISRESHMGVDGKRKLPSLAFVIQDHAQATSYVW